MKALLRGISPAYEPIAAEYYDASRHPTCANFGELSAKFLMPRIVEVASQTLNALEVGAGRSILAAVFERLQLPLDRVTLLDESTEMLAHSSHWISQGAKAVISDARSTRLPSATFELIVSSLGDPYNSRSFWREARRLISEYGRCLFTTPSFEWSNAFREENARNQAEFILRDERHIVVPSYTLPLKNQVQIFNDSGFKVAEEMTFARKDLDTAQSPKLDVLADFEREPVLYAFVLVPS